MPEPRPAEVPGTTLAEEPPPIPRSAEVVETTRLAVEVGLAALVLLLLLAGSTLSLIFPAEPEYSIFLLSVGLGLFLGQVIWLTGRLRPQRLDKHWTYKWVWGVGAAGLFMILVWGGSWLMACRSLNDTGTRVLGPIVEQRGLSASLDSSDDKVKASAEREVYLTLLGSLEDPKLRTSEGKLALASGATPAELYANEGKDEVTPIAVLQTCLEQVTNVPTVADGETTGQQLQRKLMSPMALPFRAKPAPTAKAAIQELDFGEDVKWRADLTVNFEKNDNQTLLLAQGYYEAVKKRVGEIERARNRFYGRIQFITLAFFFVALVTLASHRGRLAQQRQAADDLIKAVPKKLERINIGGGVAAKEIRNQAVAVLERWELKPSWAKVMTWRMLKVVRDRISLVAAAPILLLEQMEHAVKDQVKTILQASRRDNFHVYAFAFWFIPISGLIGTVVGFGTAMGGTDAVFRSTDASARTGAVSAVVTELAVAFDTTFVALCAVVPLFFLAHRLKRVESAEVEKTAKSLTEVVETTCFYAENAEATQPGQPA